MGKTTITVSKEFRDELEGLRINNESMEELLKRAIRGSKNQIIEYSEPFAFELEQCDDSNNNVEHINVSWRKLFESKCGDVYEFDHKPSNCITESAKVLVHEKNYIIVEFTTECYNDCKMVFDDNKLICFKLFNQ